MTKQLHIFTVGTSILNNFVKSYIGKSIVKKYPDKEIQEWGRLSPEDGRQKIVEYHIVKGDEIFNSVLNFLNSNPKKASGELNAFYRFMESYNVKKEDIVIAFLATDTGSGWLCARALYEHLYAMGYRLKKPIRVEGFGSGLTYFDEGLINLMNHTARLVKDGMRKRCRIFVNATGGFKPECAYMTVISMLLGVHGVYYMHESFYDIIRLPTPSLQMAESLRKKLEILKKPKSKSFLIDSLNWSELELKELEDRGLIVVEHGEVRLSKWVGTLLG